MSGDENALTPREGGLWKTAMRWAVRCLPFPLRGRIRRIQHALLVFDVIAAHEGISVLVVAEDGSLAFAVGGGASDHVGMPEGATYATNLGDLDQISDPDRAPVEQFIATGEPVTWGGEASDGDYWRNHVEAADGRAVVVSICEAPAVERLNEHRNQRTQDLLDIARQSRGPHDRQHQPDGRPGAFARAGVNTDTPLARALRRVAGPSH